MIDPYWFQFLVIIAGLNCDKREAPERCFIMKVMEYKSAHLRMLIFLWKRRIIRASGAMFSMSFLGNKNSDLHAQSHLLHSLRTTTFLLHFSFLSSIIFQQLSCTLNTS